MRGAAARIQGYKQAWTYTHHTQRLHRQGQNQPKLSSLHTTMKGCDASCPTLAISRPLLNNWLGIAVSRVDACCELRNLPSYGDFFRVMEPFSAFGIPTSLTGSHDGRDAPPFSLRLNTHLGGASLCLPENLIIEQKKRNEERP